MGEHPHNLARELLITIDGVPQPAPAPRLSRTPGRAVKAGETRGSNTLEILTELGYPTEEVEDLFEKEIIE